MELDRIVPNSIMSGGPEDLNLIELLWKQDVDLGVGKEVYDQSLREELERQRQLEQYKQQEKLKAQLAAREKEEKSKLEEASRWLKQNFMRDGETGEWVKLQNKSSGSSSSSKTSSGSSTLATVEEEVNEDSLTLEAALDYISSSMDPNYFTPSPEEAQVVPLPDTFNNDLTSFSQGLNAHSQAMQHPHHSNALPALTELFPTTATSPSTSASAYLENEWSEVEEYLNISLANPVPQQQTLQEGSASKQVQGEASLATSSSLSPSSALETDLPQIVEQGLFTSSDLPLLHDASLPPADLEPVPELNVSGPSTNASSVSLPPVPCAMNTSLDWDQLGEVGGLNFFDNLTALSEGSMVDDLDLQNMEGLFNTMTEASDLSAITTTDIDSLMMSEGLNESSAFFNGTSLAAGDMHDAFDGLEGATGGSNFSSSRDNDVDSGPYRKISRLSESSSDSGFGGKGAFSSSSSSASSSSSSYAGSPAPTTHTNSTNSNDTEHDPDGTRVLAHQVAHNHTYNTLPGHVPREVKKYAPKENSRKGPQCRDEKRAKELNVPFSVDEIVESPVESFNDMLTKYSLNEEQLTLIRDIRRRGKNKLAAQNCRKRKVGVIVTLSDEMIELQKVRDRLKAERAEMERETRRMKEKFGHLYTHIFQSLRDEHGQPYDPNLYSLQQSSDGNVFLVPRNVSNANTNGSSGTTTTTTTNGSRNVSGAGPTNRIKKRRSDN